MIRIHQIFWIRIRIFQILWIRIRIHQISWIRIRKPSMRIHITICQGGGSKCIFHVIILEKNILHTAIVIVPKKTNKTPYFTPKKSFLYLQRIRPANLRFQRIWIWSNWRAAFRMTQNTRIRAYCGPSTWTDWIRSSGTQSYRYTSPCQRGILCLAQDGEYGFLRVPTG